MKQIIIALLLFTLTLFANIPTYTYNTHNKRTKTTYADGTTASKTYDAMDNLLVRPTKRERRLAMRMTMQTGSSRPPILMALPLLRSMTQQAGSPARLTKGAPLLPIPMMQWVIS